MIDASLLYYKADTPKQKREQRVGEDGFLGTAAFLIIDAVIVRVAFKLGSAESISELPTIDMRLAGREGIRLMV